jgi:iron complex transport system ATP-binding protein
MSLTLLIGDRGQGKTSACQRLAERARARELSVGGIVAPAVHEAGEFVGYDLVDLASTRSARLATVGDAGVENVGRFQFLAEGLALGRSALEQAAQTAHQLVIVDEVGPLELGGAGWARQLDVLAGRRGFMLFTVRRSLADQVARRWGASAEAQVDLAQEGNAAVDVLMERITADNP